MVKETIDSLARRLAKAVPEGVRSAREDLEENFRSLLRSALGRMDLVTREEFEVQAAVLERSREKLERLEARLAELEAGRGRQRAAKKTARKKAKRKTKTRAKKAAGKRGGKPADAR